MNPREPAVIIRLVLSFFQQYIELLIIPMLILLPGSYALYKTMPKGYRSTTTLLVGQAKKVNPNRNVYVTNSQLNSQINLLINIFMSNSVLGRLAERVAREKKIGLTELTKYLKIGELRGKIRILNMGQGLVKISYDCRKPKQCYEHLTFLFKLFMEETLRPQKESLKVSTQFLKEQSNRLRTRLKKSEKQLTQFKRLHNLDLPKTFRANLNTFLSLRKSIEQDKLDLEAAKRRKEFLQKQVQFLDPALLRLRETILQILDQQRRLSILRLNYTKHHPKVKRAASKLSRLQYALRSNKGLSQRTLKQIKWAVRWDTEGKHQVAKGQKVTTTGTGPFAQLQDSLIKITILTKQITSKNIRLKNLQKRLAVYPLREQRLHELQREVQVARVTYTKLRTQQEKTLLQKELAVLDSSRRVQVIEPATYPLFPTTPKFIFLLGGGLLAALALSSLLILIAELFQPTFRNPQHASRLLGTEVVGEVGKLPPLQI